MLPLSPKNLYYTLGEFLKAWLNIIAYERELYPRESFAENSHTSFGIVVPLNRHPNVQQWQDQFVENVLETLIDVQEKSSANSSNSDVVIHRVKSISLVIFRDNVPLERFVVDTSDLKMLNNMSLDLEFEASDELNWNRVYESFRRSVYELSSCLRKSQSHRTSLEQDTEQGSTLNENNLTFDVFLDSDTNLDLTYFQPEEWTVASDKLSEQPQIKVQSFAQIDTDPLNLHCYREEVL